MAMWRKDKETQPSAAVPSKPENTKPEAVKSEAVKSEASTTQSKPETIAAPISTPGATTAPSAATIETPAAAAPVIAQAAPVAKAEPVAKAPAAAAPKFTPNPLPSNIDTRIGSGLKIRGEITGTSDMYIDGDVQGSIRIGAGVLTIGSNGRVKADAEAREILVNGSIVGNLKASDRVQLGSTGSVQGSVVTPRIGIDDGARLRGNVETARAGESRPASEAGSGKNELRAMAATQSKGE